MLLKPEVLHTYYMRDASVYWAISDDSINISDIEGDSICIQGINANHMFMTCSNALCGNRNVFEELITKPHILKGAKEMIKVLQKYVDKNEQDSSTENN